MKDVVIVNKHAVYICKDEVVWELLYIVDHSDHLQHTEYVNGSWAYIKKCIHDPQDVFRINDYQVERLTSEEFIQRYFCDILELM